MADYYPLLARALESLPENSEGARKLVYDRAKTALTGQLRNVKPPLGEEAIARELASLDEAIERIERGHAEPERPEAAGDPLAPQRPKVDASQIRRGGRRGRSLLTAVALVAVIVPIAVVAWLWRDRPAPQTPVATPSAEPSAPAAGAEPKFPERVGGGTAAPGAPPTARDPGEAARPGARPPGGQDVAVAQKAALVEENPQDPQQPKVTPGRAFWRLDAASGGQGQPLETVVRATIEVPDGGITLNLALKRNRDTALPASHTMELVFTTAPGDPAKAVRDVNPPLFRGDDGGRGVPVAALSVPVKENLFLIGLSDLRGDLDRNLDLLQNRNWIEVPVRFGSGQRATLVFEKGVAGDRVLQEAFKAWTQR